MGAAPRRSPGVGVPVVRRGRHAGPAMTTAVDRDRERRARRRARSRSSNDRTTAWIAAKILLLTSLVALGAAIYLCWSPVVNPGVQDCGSPLGFFLTDRENVTISPGLPGAPENAVALAEQPIVP